MPRTSAIENPTLNPWDDGSGQMGSIACAYEVKPAIETGQKDRCHTKLKVHFFNYWWNLGDIACFGEDLV